MYKVVVPSALPITSIGNNMRQQNNDEKATLDILGLMERIVSSGDNTEDAAGPRQFRAEISGNALAW